MAVPIALMTAACAPVPAADVADARMESGAAIHTIAAPRGISVVLVLSPTDCVSCDLDLARWVGPGRDTSTKVSVVLTREPSADEQRNLTLLRLPVAGRVASRGLGRRIASPCILQFNDGRPVSSTCDRP
jgi:hypothetical protein